MSATYGSKNWFEWFGVSLHKKGVAQALVESYFEILNNNSIKESILITRNRFKDAIVFYVKSGYEIKGLVQGSDADLMITMKKLI